MHQGCHIVTPNKKANSSASSQYQLLQDRSKQYQRYYLYETTVCAGLPVIKTIKELIATGDQIKRIEGVVSGTLANAMDVGDPSNLERLLYLLKLEAETVTSFDVASIADLQIKEAIRDCAGRYDYILCPHTATAYARWQELIRNTDEPWVLVATAHPAKFNDIIEPLLQLELALPRVLSEQLARTQKIATVGACMNDLYLKIGV